MPEGDSVRLLVDRLDRQTAGAVVVATDLRWPSCAGVVLDGARLVQWRSHGKHLLARFDDGRTLHTHLGMDGGWAVLRPGRRLPPAAAATVRARLRLDDGRTVVGTSLTLVQVLATAEEARSLGHLGPDVLAEDFDVPAAAARLRLDPDRPTVSALLDQRGVAGLGNLWVVETMFLRGIHPDRPIGSVDVEAALRLARRMMWHSVTHRTGQTTTGDRRRGQSHWVYGRSGRPCRRCGTTVAFRPATGTAYARELWWCPSCQPAADRGQSSPCPKETPSGSLPGGWTQPSPAGR